MSGNWTSWWRAGFWVAGLLWSSMALASGFPVEEIKLLQPRMAPRSFTVTVPRASEAVKPSGGAGAPAALLSIQGITNQDILSGEGPDRVSFSAAVSSSAVVQTGGGLLVRIDKGDLEQAEVAPADSCKEGTVDITTFEKEDQIIIMGPNWLASHADFCPLAETCSMVPIFLRLLVSKGTDPFGPYHEYRFPVSECVDFGTLRFGIWTDAGGSQNSFVATLVRLDTEGEPEGFMVIAFERDKMLLGLPAQAIRFNVDLNGALVSNIQPASLEGVLPAPSGTCFPLAQVLPGQGYQAYEVCLDWSDPGNSTLCEMLPVVTDPFDIGLGSVPQPPVKPTVQALDSHATEIVSFPIRFLPSRGLVGLLQHTVDAGGGIHGIRYAELFFFPEGGEVVLRDTGTLSPGDGRHRWLAAGNMDIAGNLGLVYARSGPGPADFPSVYFTGRDPDPAAPPGTLLEESVCIDGGGSITETSEWTRTASLAVDPDGCTFWATHQYVDRSGPDSWATRICAYRFPGCESPAPLLTLQGDTCPGTLNLRINGGRPQSNVVIFESPTVGADTVTVGACGSVVTGLASPRQLTELLLGPTGHGFQSLQVDQGTCGRWVQALDLGSCKLTTVETLPQVSVDQDPPKL